MANPLNRRQLFLQLATAAALASPGAASRAAAEKAPLSAVAGKGARWLPWPAGRATPGLALPDVDGVPWGLTQQAGHPVLLNFWASWCEPCLAEMPSLTALEQRLRERGLKVVPVNFKESADTVRRMREIQTGPLVWLRDSYGEAARAWGVRSFPTSVLISPRGRALLAVQGEVDWADTAVLQRLAALL